MTLVFWIVVVVLLVVVVPYCFGVLFLSLGFVAVEFV